MTSRLAYAIIIGLIGAAIVHMSIVFMLPFMSSNSIWNAEIQNQPVEEVFPISSVPSGEKRNLFLDPLFKIVACRFDLGNGALRVTADPTTAYWSVGVFDRFGTSYFSANDRIANTSNIDLAVLNPGQLRFVRQNTPDELASAIVAAAKTETGFVVVRVFSPDPTWETSTNAFLASVKCESTSF